MTLSPQAIENDQKCGLPLIPVKEIFADPDFNCRGRFGAADIVDLVRDTATRGLVEPIIARHLWEHEKNPLSQGYKYSLVAGFRRHYAYRVNEAELIPCVVRKIDSDFECRDINAVENLQRLDLNMVQEANSIKHYISAGWTREEIGARINKSPGWVQMRAQILQMPEEIQIAIAQKYILQDDIRELYSLRNDRNEMLRTAGIIRDRRKMGQTKNIAQNIQKKKKPYTIKHRRPHELIEVMDVVRDICKRADKKRIIEISELFSEQGNSIITRILGWATANSTNLELYTMIKKFADKLGVDYTMPEFKL